MASDRVQPQQEPSLQQPPHFPQPSSQPSHESQSPLRFHHFLPPPDEEPQVSPHWPQLSQPLFFFQLKRFFLHDPVAEHVWQEPSMQPSPQLPDAQLRSRQREAQPDSPRTNPASAIQVIPCR